MIWVIIMHIIGMFFLSSVCTRLTRRIWPEGITLVVAAGLWLLIGGKNIPGSVPILSSPFFLYAIVCFRDKLYKRILYPFFLYLITYLLYFAVLNLTIRLLQTDFLVYCMSRTFSECFFILIAYLSAIIFGIIILIRSNGIFLFKLPIILVSAAGFALSIICFVFLTSFYRKESVLLLISLLILTIMTGTSFFLYSRLQRAMRNQREKYILSGAENLTQKYYSNQSVLTESLMKLRHDLNNHLAVVDILRNNGEENKAQNYLKELSDNLPLVCDTGCSEVDALLTEKAFLFRKKNIHFICELTPLHDLKISHLTLCILLGNLLDNAAEAIERNQIEDRTVSLSLVRTRDMLFIRCKNPTVLSDYSSENSSDLGLLTSKTTPEHGLGLKIIRETVNKANGIFDIRIQNGTFTASIDLADIDQTN